jgi:hypothetical protein
VNFEEQLRSALRREPAPAEFKRKVMEGIRVGAATMPWCRRHAFLSIAAAILVAALIPGAAAEYRHRRHERAISAEKQLVAALSVANAKLRETRRMIHRTMRRSS